MTGTDAGNEKVWAEIEDDKRMDRFVRRVAVTAWTVTFVLVAVLGVEVAVTLVHAARLVSVGMINWSAVFNLMMPFIMVLGVISLLIAVLSTVGIFLRMRTTTLGEIQLRLAALEQMLAARGDGQ